MTELIIDENNFSQYFKDVTTHKPKKGDILACYTAKAKFISGDLKKDVINSIGENIHSSIKVIQKMAKARYLDAIKILKEMINDLLSGKTLEEVENKEYEYTAEFFYYTKKECIPIDDPHWSTITIHNIHDFSSDQKNEINSKYLL